MRKNEGVQQMEKVDAGRMGGNKKNLRRLHTRVTAQTYRKLEQWAIVEKCGPGRVVDKLVRDRMVKLREAVRRG